MLKDKDKMITPLLVCFPVASRSLFFRVWLVALLNNFLLLPGHHECQRSRLITRSLTRVHRIEGYLCSVLIWESSMNPFQE